MKEIEEKVDCLIKVVVAMESRLVTRPVGARCRYFSTSSIHTSIHTMSYMTGMDYSHMSAA